MVLVGYRCGVGFCREGLGEGSGAARDLPV
jgi:hypothetical protein